MIRSINAAFNMSTPESRNLLAGTAGAVTTGSLLKALLDNQDGEYQ
jgi:hypothetical protein